MVCKQRESLLTSFREQTRVYALIVADLKGIPQTEYQTHFRCALKMMENCIDAQRQLSFHVLTHGCLSNATQPQCAQENNEKALVEIA